MQANNRKMTYFILFFILVISILGRKSNIFEDLHDKFEDFRLSRIEQIEVKDTSLKGNSQSNINNHGVVAETKDFFFYVEKNTIYKNTKTFEDQIALIKRPTSEGKDTLNVIEDWVFFRQGKEIKRMKIDGSSVTTIFNGYSFDMRIFGNNIYFIRFSDDKLYRMDLNGRNREVVVDKKVRNMTIYNDMIYYCYESPESEKVEEKEFYLNKIKLDGSEDKLLLKAEVRDIVVDEKYLYYTDEDFRLFRLDLSDNSIEQVSDENIVKFVKDDKWIFYTLKDPDDEHRSKGLYRMDLDGENIIEVDKDSYIYEVGLGITEDWIFYLSSDDYNDSVLKRKSKDGKDSFILQEDKQEE